MILTLDWSFSHGRDWGSPDIPQSMNLKTMMKHAPEAALRPVWLYDWLKTGNIPQLGVPNFRTSEAHVPGFFEAYGTWMSTPPPSWDDVAWLRRQFDGPFMVKRHPSSRPSASSPRGRSNGDLGLQPRRQQY